MEILITGAGGFVGQALASDLARAPISIDGSDATPRLVLCDRDPAPPGLISARHPASIEWRQGDITDPAFAASLIGSQTRAVFHLAGVVSGAAEADFDTGLRVNLLAGMRLLEACRRNAVGTSPVRFVFASSIAVYGAPLPEQIDDQTLPVPTLSYGVQKLALEHLINDYSRRGMLDGRSPRLAGVVVRPPLPNGALSAFNSDLIRETAAGRPIRSPVSPQAGLWMQSIDVTVTNLRHAMTLPAKALGHQRAVLLPAVATRVGAVLDAVGRATRTDARARVDFQPDEAIEAQFGRWPASFTAQRALGLGFAVDDGIDAIVSAYLQRTT